MDKKYLTENEQQLLEFIEDYIEKRNHSPSLSNVSNCGPFNSARNIMLLEDLVERGVLEEEIIMREDKEVNIYKVFELL